MNPYRSFSTWVIGSSHSKHGKECQDYSDAEDSPLVLAVVADGHGADECFRAAQGAKIAVNCAVHGIVDLYNNEWRESARSEPKPSGSDATGTGGSPEAELLRLLIKHIVARWQITVEEDYTKNPFRPEELALAGEKYRRRYEAGERRYKAYGTTLIAAAITADYWFGIHIGDGRLTALYKDGSFDQPVPWDPKCFLNQTTSICDDDAADRARLYFSFHAEKEPPCAVFLCSDGVDDNYPVDGNEKHLFKLYRTIALTFAEDGFDSTCDQIKDLAHSFATKGKGDDTSIAGLIDMEAVKQTAEVWRKQIAEEETPFAEPARAKAAPENPGAEQPIPETPLPVQPPNANKPEQKKPERENAKREEVKINKAIANAAYQQQKALLDYKPERYGEYEKEL